MEDKYAVHNLNMVKAVFKERLKVRGSMSESYNDCVTRFPDAMLAK